MRLGIKIRSCIWIKKQILIRLKKLGEMEKMEMKISVPQITPVLVCTYVTPFLSKKRFRGCTMRCGTNWSQARAQWWLCWVNVFGGNLAWNILFSLASIFRQYCPYDMLLLRLEQHTWTRKFVKSIPSAGVTCPNSICMFEIILNIDPISCNAIY